MNLDPAQTQLVFDFSAQDVPEIVQCPKTLFTTPVGTVALDRDFGIDFSILDQPIQLAQTRYSMELTRKVQKYEPRVKLKSIKFQSDALSGRLYIR